jgi:hypothetical protein
MMSLKAISNTDLFEEVASRLKEIYREESGGKEFQFGCFNFTFHGGQFQGVEIHLRDKFSWGFRRSQTGKSSGGHHV